MTMGNTESGTACVRDRPEPEFTHLQEFIHNLPYLLMGLCGGAVLLTGFGSSVHGWLAAGLYGAYCLCGAAWIMLFVCPYCQHYGNRACPCGYGQIAARLTPRQPENQFARQFRAHIPVIVPLWVIPLAAGIAFYARHRSPMMLGLLTAFVVDAFVVVPLVSRLYGCGHCPQKHDCPWMINRNGVSA